MAFLLFWGLRCLSSEILARGILIFMLVEPGGLAFPKFILSEVWFLPFFLGAILCVGFFYRSNRLILLVLAGVLTGAAAYVRPAILYFPILVVGLLLFSPDRIKERVQRIIAFSLPYLILLTPWYVRNYSHFHAFTFSGIKGVQLMEYHVPFVWESARGIPFNEGRKIIKEKARALVSREQARLGRPLNIMEIFSLYQKIGLQELSRYPGNYLKQWIYGILKTVGGSNLTEIYILTGWHQDRIHFFDVAEPSFSKKIYRFLSRQDGFLLLEVFVRFMIALGAGIGAVAIIRQRASLMWIILLANIYFLAIPGPVGYSRYRFPVESLWFIQSWVGYRFFGDLMHKRGWLRRSSFLS
ncbi:MAG: hypothetical protein JRJ03_13060 [Deltaproteobacteria bacterium]|nr:hypothetical protein [Deltaproteobacteria bacterium]